MDRFPDWQVDLYEVKAGVEGPCPGSGSEGCGGRCPPPSRGPVPRCRASVVGRAMAAAGVFVGQGIAVPLSPAGRKCVRIALGRRDVSVRPRKTRALRDGMLRPLLYWMMDL
jgi:hypothetical protein